MIIHEGLENFKPVKNAITTSGTFDGVHLGHQKIIKKLNESKRAENGQSVLITFWPHPKHVLFPEQKNLKILSTFEEKSAILDQLGVDHLIKVNFTKAFSQISSETFIKDILKQKIGTQTLIIGYDHRFGRNREGSFEHLKSNSNQYGFKVVEIPAKDVNSISVSSTKIRNALATGEVVLANKYLGRLYSLTGTVVNGNKLGQKIGFPTANISIKEPHKLIPADGIYAVRVSYQNNSYEGMLSIGVRPTIGFSERTIEVNIFDFDQTIYGEDLSLHFVEKFRDEVKFDNLEALKQQLKADWRTAKQILSKQTFPV